MLCQRLPSPSTTTRRLVLQNLPTLGLPALIRPPPIWRVLNKLRCERLPNNEALQWAILSTQSLLRLVFCHNAVSVNFKHDIRSSYAKPNVAKFNSSILIQFDIYLFNSVRICSIQSLHSFNLILFIQFNSYRFILFNF